MTPRTNTPPINNRRKQKHSREMVKLRGGPPGAVGVGVAKGAGVASRYAFESIASTGIIDGWAETFRAARVDVIPINIKMKTVNWVRIKNPLSMVATISPKEIRHIEMGQIQEILVTSFHSQISALFNVNM